MAVEPSKEAIAYGETHYPNVHFLNATADDMNKFGDESFDVVIVGFVFYVIKRRLLLKSISEIDRVLKDKGYLIIMDFFTETTVKKTMSTLMSFQLILLRRIMMKFLRLRICII
ncbi:class I SAM-dependent methyltransferase [Flavisolibacter ginsengisoli]|jgi:ubiquinone/menaquinone biosynthesis C-methylase UbiE|uniref:Methyltransferase domain-containing protein n=1 Tax=Flavisolibacter ginsengisoli DSM 18119 TaxID=1121884 RepID=A0A1M4VFL5_9BACT|nr:Methyltransferase domain-containing protein [Flavisolibacter ginsengisoli DSM 18119]